MSIIDNMRNQYEKDALSHSKSFIEYLIINNKYSCAKLLVEKEKILNILYDKYVHGDMSLSFEEYILTNPLVTVKEIFTSNDIIEFEKSKIDIKGKTKNKKII